MLPAFVCSAKVFALLNSLFYPGGAEAVRIAFLSEPTGTWITIHDPDVVLSALRKS